MRFLALTIILASAPDVQSWLQGADATRNAFEEAVITARAFFGAARARAGRS